MKKKTHINLNDNIEFSFFIKLFLQQKRFILFCSFVFLLLGFLFGYIGLKFEAKKYQVSFEVAYPKSNLFEKYELILNQNNKVSIDFETIFRRNLLSKENMVFFADQSKHAEVLKVYLKKKNISMYRYFDNNIITAPTTSSADLSDRGIISSKYFFEYSEHLIGDLFINDYILFIRDKSINEIIDVLKYSISNMIFVINNNLEIANNIYMKNNNSSKIDQKIGPYSFEHVNPYSFEHGNAVLSIRKKILTNLLMGISPKEFEYYVFANKASIPKSLTKINIVNYTLSGFFAGFIISILIIFFKKFSK